MSVQNNGWVFIYIQFIYRRVFQYCFEALYPSNYCFANFSFNDTFHGIAGKLEIAVFFMSSSPWSSMGLT